MVARVCVCDSRLRYGVPPGKAVERCVRMAFARARHEAARANGSWMLDITVRPAKEVSAVRSVGACELELRARCPCTRRQDFS